MSEPVASDAAVGLSEAAGSADGSSAPVEAVVAGSPGPADGAPESTTPGWPEGFVSKRAALPEGDFELERPDGAGSEGEAASVGEVAPGRPAEVGGGGGALSDGDFELRAPRDVAGSEAGGGSAVGSRGDAEGAGSDDPRTGGDYELHRPAEAPFAPMDSAAVPAPPAPAAERPRPLHDPDPYSTPPYGEPGPWAPAPPVQHPAATPAQGTAIPMPTPPHAAPTPVPPQAHGTPVAGAHAPMAALASHGAPAPTQPPGIPAQLAPPALGTPAPVAGAPDPMAVPASHGAPAPTQPAGIPAQLPPPAPATPAPVPTPHGAPAPTQPLGIPAPAAPAPSATPWQNYDPWAPAPLQQTGAGVESKDQRRRVKRGLVGGAVVLALVAGGVGGVIGAYLERNGGLGAVELPQAGKEPVGRAPDSVAGIAARALPSVVTLHVTGAEESGTGTGFVLDDRGHILTNNHVVEPAAGSSGEISVTFNSGDTAKATVVGRDSGYDLAVVKVSNVRGLKPMALGNSDNVRVGDPVVAIGAPFDLAGTVTSGIISAKERPITAGGDSSDGSDVSYVDALQTDAPINPGNSGGPLLDSEARVIGINSAIRSADSGSGTDESGQAGSIGLGFAIPVNQAKRVAEELINTGKATHPVIGVTLDMDYTGDGARVGTKASGGGPAVTAGGPGEKAGIKAGDIITEVDGQRVHSGEELIVKTRAHRPGDRLELTVRRDGKEKKIALVLGSADGD
ncbi:trypsin-like peptidase domain-containing protein [Streptomyces coacervatus]|uniref:S1C family serine protease n=1 Tax=Streptomyces coacervatus TaxID=647381 RepID=UPI0023DC3297|nr:trypsin-like peptidase domain-containing protein [Streptomyces coacervatus]MDF2270064.1 trypsin-like peptidase domain-containing protein [Streptomyces coacervatus]